MQEDEVFQILESTGAIRKGHAPISVGRHTDHFLLSSGRHSDMYVQCALVLQNPLIAERLGRALAARFADLPITVVASPAIGGIVIGQEVGRAVAAQAAATQGSGQTVRAIFAERDPQGVLTLRRGFTVNKDDKVLVVEDVWTTGKSTLETIRVIEAAGGHVSAAGALIDRSGGRLDLGVRTAALLALPLESYAAEECPLCKAGGAAVRPGSRYSRPAP